MSRLIDHAGPLTLNGSGFAAMEVTRVHAAYTERHLCIDGRRAYEVGNGCDTCRFWFTRLDGANQDAAIAEARDRLTAGIGSADDPVVELVGRVLGRARYLVLLLDLIPRLVRPLDVDDYFVAEQIDLWGVDGFSDLPHHPAVSYYRPDEGPLRPPQAHARVFEFVVPMYPATWLHDTALEAHTARLERGEHPTAVALSVLDRKQPADWPDGTPVTEHWCLAHFLLDGHHKVAAASTAGKPVRLLSFLAIDDGLSSTEDVDRLVEVLSAAPTEVR